MKVKPLHSTITLDFFPADISTELKLPFISGGISAGFPSPAQDFMGEKIDLNRILVKHPSETFYAKVKGNSMKDVGIHDGDTLVIDRSLAPEDGKIFVCFIDGEFTVKRVQIEKKTKTIWLVAENEAYQPIKVTEENESFLIWGRVIHVIKDF
jgi:DNA polymerase V